MLGSKQRGSQNMSHSNCHKCRTELLRIEVSRIRGWLARNLEEEVCRSVAWKRSYKNNARYAGQTCCNQTPRRSSSQECCVEVVLKIRTFCSFSSWVSARRAKAASLLGFASGTTGVVPGRNSEGWQSEDVGVKQPVEQKVEVPGAVVEVEERLEWGSDWLGIGVMFGFRGKVYVYVEDWAILGQMRRQQGLKNIFCRRKTECESLREGEGDNGTKKNTNKQTNKLTN